jgi:natural product precursor
MKKKLKLNCVNEALNRDELRMIKGGGSGGYQCTFVFQPCYFLGRSGTCY